MAAGQERLISLAELQAFRIGGVKEGHVEGLRPHTYIRVLLASP